MSKLFGLARQASEYIRNRFQKQYRDADEVIDAVTSANSDYARQRRNLINGIRDLLGSRDARQQPPYQPQRPQQPPGPYQPPMPGPPPYQPPGPYQPTTPGAPPVQPWGQPEPMPPLPPLPPIGAPPTPPPAAGGGGQKPPKKPPTGGGAASGGDGGDGGDDDGYGPELGYGDIQLLGRDAGYHEAEFLAVMTGMRRTPNSSNVWGYFFEREARRTGILYVTFLQDYRGQKTNAPGPTYAYYDVPVKKALEFQKATAESAGGAVWDYLRVRGSIHAHQHQYRLVHVNGEYVPRKVTPVGFRNRAVPALGIGRREYRRNTLPERRFFNRGEPNRGEPNRGEPDRG